MQNLSVILSLFLIILFAGAPALAKNNQKHDEYKNDKHQGWNKSKKHSVSLGPRPFYLVDDMDESKLKKALQQCKNDNFYQTDFSIGHRGAPMQFPEHTKESYVAAARMGAGIIECDVTFTKDRQLVCRHSQCDLHTTTNIVATELGQKCTQPFTPADPASGTPASASCCTSDITLAEYKTLCGKMDAADRSATTAEAYLGGTAAWRTDLYSSCGTLLTHKESIELFKTLDAKFTPELKAPSVPMPFEGEYSQEDYAQQMIDEYIEAGVHPRKVFPQSFNLNDVLYWIESNPAYGKQAVFLDGRYETAGFDHRDPSTWEPSMEELVAADVQIIAPPMWVLVEVVDGKIKPSVYAKAAKAAGLDIITWTFERDGPLANGGAWYFQTLNGANPNPDSVEPVVINNDGDMYEVLHVLAKQVGILGIFSDWPATVTYYANCMNLK